eukprot:194097_1
MGNKQARNENPFKMRLIAINNVVQQIENEKQYFMDKIKNYPKYDKETQKCIHIVSYWSRNWKSKSLKISNIHDSIVFIALNIITQYLILHDKYFNRTKKDQFEAKFIWLSKKLEYTNKKIKFMTELKKELQKFKSNYETNNQIKTYWKCEQCRHCKISLLWIKYQQCEFSTSYRYQYKDEDTYSLQMICYNGNFGHEINIYPFLKKHNVFKMYQVHKCDLCSYATDNIHVMETNKTNNNICDICLHAKHSHVQIWGKFPDEFGGHGGSMLF